jgi:hypothetical protein
VETAGPRLSTRTSEYLKRSEQLTGHQATPGGKTKFQGVLVKKTIVRVAASASALVAVLLAGGALKWK